MHVLYIHAYAKSTYKIQVNTRTFLSLDHYVIDMKMQACKQNQTSFCCCIPGHTYKVDDVYVVSYKVYMVGITFDDYCFASLFVWNIYCIYAKVSYYQVIFLGNKFFSFKWPLTSSYCLEGGQVYLFCLLRYFIMWGCPQCLPKL